MDTSGKAAAGVMHSSVPSACPPAAATRSASAAGSSASSSCASASGADQTIDIRRPGSGSHASTPPSLAEPLPGAAVMGALAAKLATTRRLAVRPAPWRRCRRPRAPTIARPSAATTSRAVTAEPSSKRSVARVARPRERREGARGAHRRRLPHARAQRARRAARAPRRSTPARARPDRRPRSRASRRASPATRIGSIGAMRSGGERLPRADRPQERRAAGADRVDARVPIVVARGVGRHRDRRAIGQRDA